MLNKAGRRRVNKKVSVPFTGIILAGGESSRLGTDKAFLKIGRNSIIEETIGEFKNMFKEIIIVANRIERFNFLGVKIFSDIFPAKGPLGGIYTGLVKSNNFYNFITACDMPFINYDLVRSMLAESRGYDVVIAERKRRLEPLCAVYSQNCIAAIEKEILKHNLKITGFLKYVKVKIISEKEIVRFDAGGFSFANINTPQDYRKIKEIKFLD